MVTTGTRLLEWLGLIDNPMRRVRTSQGDVLRVVIRRPRGESIGYYRMTPAEPFEVDGIRYAAAEMPSLIRFFSIKNAVDCWSTPDEDDRCHCAPYEYEPLPYGAGEIDEELWLKHGVVVGKG